MHARLSQISLLLEQRRDAYNEHNFSMSGGPKFVRVSSIWQRWDQQSRR